MHFFIFILFLIISPFAITGWLFAPWVPIGKSELTRLKFLKLKRSDVFYELGCGDGRVVEYIKDTFGCESIGIELNPFLFLICMFRRGKFIFGNLFSQNFSNATCVYLFGLPKKINEKLKIKLEKELKPGTKVISYGFQIQSWKPVKVYKANHKLSIYVYNFV